MKTIDNFDPRARGQAYTFMQLRKHVLWLPRTCQPMTDLKTEALEDFSLYFFRLWKYSSVFSQALGETSQVAYGVRGLVQGVWV